MHVYLTVWMYQNRYGGIGPKEEDINTMYRYRDAIVYKNRETEAYNNRVFGAFVLFPYIDEFLDLKGFSSRNLKYMRKFAAEYQDIEFVQEALA